MQSQAKIRVRYSETDQMGIVHHSNYVNWFEIGRTDHITHLGYTYGEIEAAGFYLPVIGVHVTYHSPARYEDLIVIETTIEKYNGVRLHFKYKAIRELDSELVAEGITEHCWTTTSMKPIKLQRKWPDLHEKIEASYQGSLV